MMIKKISVFSEKHILMSIGILPYVPRSIKKKIALGLERVNFVIKDKWLFHVDFT